MLNQITTNTIAGSPYCAGTTINVNFNAIGVANSGNIYTAQLSDASGSFASPINIGSLTSVNAGAITSTIPANTASGTGYRIRVISSDPVVIGSDNGSNLSINNLSIVTASASPETICQGAGSTLTATGATSYSWYPTGSLSSSTGASVIASPTVTTTYTVTGTMTGNEDVWIQKADFGGIGKWAAAGFSIGTKGYIGTGGVIADDYRNDFWEYDSLTNTWAQKANYPGAGRVGATGLSIGTKGYMGAGFLPGFNVQSDFWEYDPATNIWTQKANTPSARAGLIGFSIGMKGYLGMGTEAGYITKKDFWEYNPNTDVWIQKADFGGGIRVAAVAFSIGSKGYVGTGGDGVGYTKDFWEYNPATDIWTKKADFGGTGRYTASGFSVGTKGYIGLGWDGSIKNDIWEYNADADTWTQKSNLPVLKQQAVAFSIGNKAYVGTGHDPSNDRGENDFWEYNPGVCSNTATVTVQVNTVPVITSITPSSISPVPIGTSVSLAIAYTDDNVTSVTIDWDDAVIETFNTTDNPIIRSHTYTVTGIYAVAVTLKDACDAVSASYVYNYIVVYDPNGGFVTGGGWINSPVEAYKADMILSGKANFGFVAKYKKGSNIPIGSTEFQFQLGNLNFNSSSYEAGRLVIAGAKANYKGVGTINGAGNYGFLVSAIDGQITGGGGIDKFRIKIWDKNNGNGVVYDNNIVNTDEDADPATAISGGSIMIHEAKKNTTARVELDRKSTDSYLFNAKIYPNPTNQHFTLVVEGSSKEKIEVMVYDILGRLMSHIKNSDNNFIRFGKELPFGYYIAVVKQGANQETVKLIKQK